MPDDDEAVDDVEASQPSDAEEVDVPDAEGALRLPNANEFSPGTSGLTLTTVLETVQKHAGDGERIIEEFRRAFFEDTAQHRGSEAERHGQQRTRAYNILRGMKQYGLVSEDDMLSDVGRTLLSEPDEANRLRHFARHILLSLYGLEVLEVVQAMQDEGSPVNKISLHRELKKRGFDMGRPTTTRHLLLLKWLRAAGVLRKRPAYAIDDDRLAELTGLSLGAVREWTGLTRLQANFLETLYALAAVRGDGFLPQGEVFDILEENYGPLLNPDQARANILDPLEQAEWIETRGRGKGRGGGRGAEVRATAKLMSVDLDVMKRFNTSGIPADVRELLRQDFSAVRMAITSDKTGEKGRALEVLTVRMAADLGLYPIQFESTARTGGGEVDVVAEGVQFHFSRWLFQCKNTTERVTLSTLAKEIGMATLLRAHVVVIVTTETFTQPVYKYRNEIAQTTPLQIVLVSGNVLDEYQRKGAPAIMSFFRKAAAGTLRLKRPQVLDVGESVEPAQESR